MDDDDVVRVHHIRYLKWWHFFDIIRITIMGWFGMAQSLSVDEFVGRLRTGTIVLGEGRGPAAFIQRLFTNGPASHVFMAVKLKSGQMALVEVTREDAPPHCKNLLPPNNRSSAHAVWVCDAKERVCDYLAHEGTTLYARNLVGLTDEQLQRLGKNALETAVHMNANGVHFERRVLRFVSFAHPWVAGCGHIMTDVLLFIPRLFGFFGKKKQPTRQLTRGGNGEDPRVSYCSEFVTKILTMDIGDGQGVLNLRNYKGPMVLKPSDFTANFEPDFDPHSKEPRNLPWSWPTYGLASTYYI